MTPLRSSSNFTRDGKSKFAIFFSPSPSNKFIQQQTHDWDVQSSLIHWPRLSANVRGLSRKVAARQYHLGENYMRGSSHASRLSLLRGTRHAKQLVTLYRLLVLVSTLAPDFSNHQLIPTPEAPSFQIRASSCSSTPDMASALQRPILLICGGTYGNHGHFTN